MTTRYATITHGATGSREGIARHLPSNYSVLGGDDDVTLIGGVDSAGWTLDDYVLPRLASGLYFGTEFEAPGWLKAIFDHRLEAGRAFRQLTGDELFAS